MPALLTRISILPSCANHLVDERLDLITARHVDLGKERAAAQGGQLGRDPLAVFHQQIADRHVGAGLGQRQRHLAAQAARASCHDCHPAVQPEQIEHAHGSPGQVLSPKTPCQLLRKPFMRASVKECS